MYFITYLYFRLERTQVGNRREDPEDVPQQRGGFGTGRREGDETGTQLPARLLLQGDAKGRANFATKQPVPDHRRREGGLSVHYKPAVGSERQTQGDN